MFRTNYAVGTSTTDRTAWLPYFISAKCPTVLPAASLVESVYKNAGVDAAIEKLNALSQYADDHDAASKRVAENITQGAKKIEDQEKKDVPDQTQLKIARDEIEKQRGIRALLEGRAGLVVRIKALNTFLSTKTPEFLEALVWKAYDANFSGKPRLTFMFTSQDAQLIKTNMFHGQRVFGQGTGELIYRATDSTGGVVALGFLTITVPLGKADFDNGEPLQHTVLK